MASDRGLFQKPPGSGNWWISYCDPLAKRRRENAHTRSKAVAREYLNRRRLEIKEGRWIPPRAGARLSFRNLALGAMAHKKARLASSSYKTDEGRLKQLLPLMGSVVANRPDVPMRIQEALTRLKNSGLSGSTINRFHALISSVFKFAVDAGHIENNPTKKVKRYKENASRIRWLRPEEEKAIRDEGLVSDVHEYEFDLALNTGMRRGEQFGLQWKDVDFANKRLIVRGKTGTRPIRLNTAAISALRKLQEVTGKKQRHFVSPDAGDEVKRDSRRWFEKACKKAGVTDFHWHDLRHTFASRLVMGGSDIVSVKELLGHKDVKMTMKYAHLAPSHLDEAVEKMVQQEPTR